jgi:hypothetical protein
MGPRDRNSKGGDPGRLRIGRPSKDLTERVLNEVDFEDRLTGYRLSKRTGVTTIRLSSFEEVVGLLNETHPRLDFDRLEQWIRETMGDPELSGKIRESGKNWGSYAANGSSSS